MQSEGAGGLEKSPKEFAGIELNGRNNMAGSVLLMSATLRLFVKYAGENSVYSMMGKQT